ncbi:hypothetical protein [Rossellomorea aquimaris]|nr:hypothetical protein [Rossellomorea aquimaris]
MKTAFSSAEYKKDRFFNGSVLLVFRKKTKKEKYNVLIEIHKYPM